MGELTAAGQEIRAKLKECDPSVREYVAALEAKVVKCARVLAAIEVENLTAKARVESLKDELAKKVDLATLSKEELWILDNFRTHWTKQPLAD